MNTISNIVIDQLSRTKGWTLFFSVFLWIGAALMFLAGIAMAVAISLGGLAGAGGADNPLAGMGGPLLGIGLGAFYFLIGVAYIYPALKLGKFSKKVSHLINHPSEEGLASALNEQRAFWKYAGIMIIVTIGLYIVIILGAVIFGVMGAATLKSA